VCSPSPRSGANSEAAAGSRGKTHADAITSPFIPLAPAALTIAPSTAAAITFATSAAITSAAATAEPFPKSAAAAVSPAARAAGAAAAA
jgi:hypothetical protein